MDYTKIKEQKKILLSFKVLNVHKIITYSAIENTLLNGFSFTEKATLPLKVRAEAILEQGRHLPNRPVFNLARVSLLGHHRQD